MSTHYEIEIQLSSRDDWIPLRTYVDRSKDTYLKRLNWTEPVCVTYQNLTKALNDRDLLAQGDTHNSKFRVVEVLTIRGRVVTEI